MVGTKQCSLFFDGNWIPTGKSKRKRRKEKRSTFCLIFWVKEEVKWWTQIHRVDTMTVLMKTSAFLLTSLASFTIKWSQWQWYCHLEEGQRLSPQWVGNQSKKNYRSIIGYIEKSSAVALGPIFNFYHTMSTVNGP